MFAVDLGIDSIVVYDRDLNYVSSARVPDGNGPRHAIFSPDGSLCYCLNELSSSVSVFRYNDGEFAYLADYPALPDSFTEKNTAAAIRYHNGYVYTSNRGHNSITVFKVHGEKLVPCSFVPCGGELLNLYSYDKNNRLVSRNIDGTTTNYTYDRQGNLVYDGTSVYRYNGFNRLVGINSDHSNISYTYDHTGLRTGKTVNGVYTKLINDEQDVVAQYVDGRGSYFYRGINLIGYTNSYNDVNFYRFNAHGDVTSVVDCFGNVVRNYEYDAFGKQRVNPKIVINARRDDNPFRYCGEYYDNETGLIYLRARYYNPDLQRFISEDPVKDGLNWYVYCHNDPVNFMDWNGYEEVSIFSFFEHYGGKVTQNKKGWWIFSSVKSITVEYHNKSITYDVKEFRKSWGNYYIDDTILREIFGIPDETNEIERIRAYGRAKEYVDVTDDNINCYAYAIGYSSTQNPGFKGIGINYLDSPEKLTLDIITQAVISDFRKGNVRIIDNFDSPIETDEYRIALRIGFNQTVGFDYHFMRQNSDGSWSEKFKQKVSRSYKLGETPDTISWNYDVYENFYNSETRYFAIKEMDW